MTNISGQTVVMFIGAGLATVGIFFILYWKLLGERRLRLQQAKVTAPAIPRQRQQERALVSGRVAEELN